MRICFTFLLVRPLLTGVVVLRRWVSGWPVGSSASRSPSPNRLKASTVMKIASPGQNMKCGACSRSTASESMPPQDAVGRPDADAEEGQRRLEQDVGRDQQRRVDEDRRDQVGQQLPERM